MVRYRIVANGNTIYDTQNKNDYPVSKPQLELELNNAGTLSFIVYPGHPYYSSITKMQTFVTAYKNDEEVFYGRVLSTEKSLDGRLTVNCEGGITFFLDSEIGKLEVTETVQEFFTRCINAHNNQVESSKRFTVGNITVAKKNESHLFKLTDWQDTKSVLESSLLGQFGGFLNVRPKSGGGHYIDYVENFGRTNTQPIQIGVNIIDKDDNISGENIFTILHPLGKTSSSGAGQDTDVTLAGLSQSDISLQNVTLVGQNLELTDKISLYGRITRTERFQSAETPIDLLHKAEEFITRRGTQLPGTCDMNLVNFNLLNPEIMDIYLGDTFNNIEGFSGQVLTVGELTIDMENPSNDKVIFKNPEEINSNRLDTNVESGGDSGGSMSDKMSKSKSQEAFRYKYIREEEDKLILFAKNTEINASEKFSALSNKIFLTAEESESGEPGELVLKAVKHIDDKNGSTLVMNVNGISLNTTTEAAIVDGVEEIKGTGIWTHRDHIDAVAGKYTIDLDGNVHVIDGSNLYLGEGTASMGVYTEGNLTGGILVDKINNDGTVTTQTQLRGDLVNITANQSFQTVVGDISTQGAAITANTNNINLKVNADGVISAINISPESIDIDASKINLNGYVTMDQFRATKAVVDNLFSGNTQTGSLSVSNSLSAASVYANAYYIGRSESDRMVQKVLKIGTVSVSGGQMVGLGTAGDVNLIHYHDISANVDSSGNVTITMGQPSSGPTSANFNIADTEFYKKAMANPSVSNVSVSLSGTPWDDGVWGYMMQSGTVSMEVNGQTVNKSAQVNVTTAYEAGRTFGKDQMGLTIQGSTIKSAVSGTKQLGITVDVGTSFDPDTHLTSATAVVYANGNKLTDKSTNGIALPYNAGKTAGQNSVTISSITKNGTTTYSSNYKTVYIPVTATMSPTGLTGSSTVSSDISTAYNYAVNSVTISASNITEYQNAYYNSTTHNTTVYIQAEASNGKTGRKTFTVSGASAYSAGQTAGETTGWSDCYNAVRIYNSYTDSTGSRTINIGYGNTVNVIAQAKSSSGASYSNVGTVTVKAPTPSLTDGSATSNGTYYAYLEGYDYYSSFTVNVQSSVEIGDVYATSSSSAAIGKTVRVYYRVNGGSWQVTNYKTVQAPGE